MRRAALSLMIVAALGIDGEAAETSFAFDHGSHASHADRKCVDCHAVDNRGRPKRIGHAACFGQCHGDTPAQRTARDRARKKPYSIASQRRAVCTACHSPDALDRVETGSAEVLAWAPSRRVDSAVSAPLSHTAHATVKADCLACHTASGKSKNTAHQRCEPCHRAAARPAMTECASCHTGKAGAAISVYSTQKLFDHSKHAPRLAKNADKCRACHAPDAIRPAKSTCAGCHDGAAAFSMVEAKCRRCHSPPAAPVPRPRPSRKRFSHESHAGLERKLECTSCHRLDAAGEPKRPANQHAPCSDSDCHAADFGSGEPAVCGACHVGTEPWLHLYASVTPPADTEFGALYSHKGHSGGEQPRHRRACIDCHSKNTSRRQLRLSRGHTACSGNGCHEPTGSKFALESCSSCHIGNLVAERRQRRSEARWSVRDKFSHNEHQKQPGKDDVAVPCTDCHDKVDGADTIFDIPAPSKASCSRCHDGQSAFKLTGHGCSRCHDS